MSRNSDRLAAVLAEYNALRAELIDKSRLHVNIFAAYLSALILIYGAIYLNKLYDAVIVIPLISISLLYRIIWDQQIISEISRYIKYEIEQQKLPILLGTIAPVKNDFQDHKYSNLWLGWQTSYYLNKDRLHPFYERSLVMLFVIISSTPPILFNIYIIINNFVDMGDVCPPIKSYFSIKFNIIFLISDLILTIYSYILIRKHIIGRRNWWIP